MKKIVIPFTSTIIVFIAMRLQGHTLNNMVSKRGIVDLEFATTAKRLNAILANWNYEVVKNNILIDYFFIIFYSWLFYLLVDLTVKYTLKKWVIFTGNFFKKMVIAIALLDVLENALMLFTIRGLYNSFTLNATAVFATIKFGLVLLVIIYLIFALFIRIINKRTI